MTTPNNSDQYLPGVIQIPSALQITDITQAYPAVITATVNNVTASNTYIPGQLIRLNIPRSYGMYQANGKTVQILSINGLAFTVNLDTTNYNPFSLPGATAEQPASFAPAGSRNLEFNNITNVGFQSLNNVGN